MEHLDAISVHTSTEHWHLQVNGGDWVLLQRGKQSCLCGRARQQQAAAGRSVLERKCSCHLPNYASGCVLCAGSALDH
jgi:hypothetical protein